MPCIVNITNGEMANHWETLLCYACKFLTREQIESLRNPGSGIMDGLEWYTQHLMGDYTNSGTTATEKSMAITELDRLGFYILKEKNYMQLRERGQ